jgi:Asp-tRNA(Asn)/Glu-tRNA(Gln) amidotransferase C subunit
MRTEAELKDFTKQHSESTVYLLTLPTPQKSAVECYNEARDLIEKTWVALEGILTQALNVSGMPEENIRNLRREIGEYLKRTRRIPTDAVEPTAKPAEVKAQSPPDLPKQLDDAEKALANLARAVEAFRDAFDIKPFSMYQTEKVGELRQALTNAEKALHH